MNSQNQKIIDLAVIAQSIYENPRTPHFITKDELKKYMIITSKEIKLKSDVIIIEYEEQPCIVVYDKTQNIYKLKLLPSEFKKIFNHFSTCYCTCNQEICNCMIASDYVYFNDLEHYVETAGEGLIMNEYSDFISRDNYKFNPNGFTLKTIIIDNY